MLVCLILKTSIGDFCPKVKSPTLRTFRLPKVLAVPRSESSRRVFLYLYAISDQKGFFELDAAKIAQQTGLSRKTVYKAIAFLQWVRLLSLEEARTGRGKHSLYKLNWRKPAQKHHTQRKEKQHSQIDERISNKKCHPCNNSIVKRNTQAKDPRSEGVKKSSPSRNLASYTDSEAAQIALVLGARFYRHVMRAIRLGLESWAIPKAICEALEGFFGLRIDGASLTYARELRDRIWALRREVEALAARGATPRRVCSFVAGRLAGVPERRAKREVLKRTAELIHSVEQLERRIAGLRVWLAEREGEYRAGQVCKRCGYRHTTIEYHSGYREDGTGKLNCMGWARWMLDVLHEERKKRKRLQDEQRERCVGKLWAEWARQQLQERAWHKKQAEFVRQCLSVLPGEGFLSSCAVQEL